MVNYSISISNLKEIINEAVILYLNFRQLRQVGDIAMKAGLQNLIFPSGLVYEKKNGAFRTSELNFIISQITRHKGDLILIKRDLIFFFETKAHLAEKEGLTPLFPEYLTES